MEKTLSISHQKEWPADADQYLAPAMENDPTATVHTLKTLCYNNEAHLYQICEGANLVAYFVLRVQPTENGNEGVIVAGAGKLKGISLTRKIVPVIESFFVDCNWVRVHTARRGLIKQLQKMGYIPQEVVLRKDIKNGRSIKQ